MLTDNSKGLTELQHLKSLYVSCAPAYRLNSLIRKLCYNRIIEELIINHGVFDDDDQDASPQLKYNKLRTIYFRNTTRLSRLLKTMSRSQMPDFVYLKIRIGTIRLYFINDDYIIALAIWRQIICVLKEPGTSIRPLLIIIPSIFF